MDKLDYRMVVAAGLGTAIRLSGLTIKEVAKSSDLHPVTVTRILNGEREATATTIFKICAATGVNPVRIFDGSLCRECLVS